MAEGRPQPSTESLEDVQADLWALRREVSTWHFDARYFHFSGRFNSGRFARYFVGFHGLAGTIGGVMIFFSDPLRSLGVAMVVGTLFGFGTFIGQVWTMQVTREHWLTEDKVRSRAADIDARLNRALENQPRSNGSEREGC